MAVENRNLEAGTRLVANYKKQRYVCSVEAAEGGEGVAFVLEDGSRHKSPSAAAMKVMGGKAVNGWRFWRIESGDEAVASADIDELLKNASKPTKEPKVRKPKKLIYRSPNQQRVAEGKTRWFCCACMKAFVKDGNDEPEVCPDGHRIDDPELTGSIEAVNE
jgi:hypothetical protein